MSDYLPDEVVVDILHRLPVKSLIRFRCVCRSWNSLIQTPAFIHSHLNQSIENNHNNNLPHPLLIVRYCDRYSNVEHYKLFRDNKAFDECTELEFPIECRGFNHFRLIGSENGLICFAEEERFILWNPSIRKVVTLPTPCITKKTHGRSAFCQAFGFDPRTNDFKVVRIAFPYTEQGSRRVNLNDYKVVEVYSVSTGSWRITNASFPSLAGVLDWVDTKACLKGCVHFAGYTPVNRTSDKNIFSFDLRDEVFREMILPDNIVGLQTSIFTSVFRGLLALLCYDRYERKCCSIWVMKEYGVVDSWVKQFTIDIAGGIQKVLGFRKNGHIILETETIGDWELSSYDTDSQQATKLGIHGRPHYFCVDTYRENLVLLNQANDTVYRSRVTKKRKNRASTSSTSTSKEHELSLKVTQLKDKIRHMESKHEKARNDIRMMLQMILDGGVNPSGVQGGNMAMGNRPDTESPRVSPRSSVGSRPGESLVVEEDDADAGQVGAERG